MPIDAIQYLPVAHLHISPEVMSCGVGAGSLVLPVLKVVERERAAHLDVPHARLDTALIRHWHELLEFSRSAGGGAAGTRWRATALRAGLRGGPRTRGSGRLGGYAVAAAAAPLRVVRDGAVGGKMLESQN